MKLVTILLILTVLSVVIAVDYCEVEKRLCGSHKHIGCEKNVFENMQRITGEKFGLKLGKTTNESIESLVGQLNSFRSAVATRQNDSSSNMRLVTWDNELEYLARQLVLKLPFMGIACSKTDNFPDSKKFEYEENLFYTPGATLTTTFEFILLFTAQLRSVSHLRFSRMYSANLTSIGCAFGYYTNNYEHEIMVIKCITNIADASSLKEINLPGSPCSKCSMYNQVCSKTYHGLCESVDGPIGLEDLGIVGGEVKVPTITEAKVAENK